MKISVSQPQKEEREKMYKERISESWRCLTLILQLVPQIYVIKFFLRGSPHNINCALIPSNREIKGNKTVDEGGRGRQFYNLNHILTLMYLYLPLTPIIPV